MNEAQLTDHGFCDSCEGPVLCPAVTCGDCAASGSPPPLADGEYRVPSHRLAELVKRVARLNRRGAKLGCDPVGFELLRRESEEVTRVIGSERYVVATRDYDVVRPVGSAPRVGGHTFVARLEHTPAGNLVSRAPGEGFAELHEQWRFAANRCDHCSMARRRRDTFVLRALDGALLQVGRNCLADFLRTTDVAAALRFWDLLDELASASGGDDSEGGYGDYSRLRVTVLGFVAAAASSARHSGYVSREAAKSGDR